MVPQGDRYRWAVPAPVVLCSNRGPLSFAHGDDGLVARRGGGGLISGLAPIVEGTDTIWMAVALGDGDRRAASRGVIEADGLRVRTLDIPDAVLGPAYDTVCNSMLWFLHHGLHDLSRRPVVDAGFRAAWDSYRRYNEVFAATLTDEAPDDAIVLVQDYHLALLAPMLRDARPDLRTVHFSHTPFSPPMQLRVLPDDLAVELLTGVAGHDACGFHSARWEDDFRRCCREIAGIEPHTFVSPLGPDPGDMARAAAGEACEAAVREIEESVGDRRLIVRVDRLELSKNLLRGFRAYDTLLADRPDLREAVVFRVLGYPSREGLPEYLAYRSEVETLVDVINQRWGVPGWTPIELDLRDDFPRSVAHLRRYDVLMVNPIRDGLNLVAAEGPLVNERNGTVVLSREAGIHDGLVGAVRSINPFDVADQAAALAEALDRSPEDRAAAAAELRRRAGARTPADWFADQLAQVS